MEVGNHAEQRMLRLKQCLGGSSGELQALRVPGRVNLIGEHTDYNNCPVFPMAVNREVLALFRAREDGMIRVRDAQPEYGSIEFPLETQIAPDKAGSWGNYFKAGIQELILSAESVPSDIGALRGFDMAIDSTIPPAAGMSSSSALVVLASLAFLAVNSAAPATRSGRLALAELCARGERYTGTQGGGMDQAAIMLGRAGHAMKIDFNPLRSREAPLPQAHVIVVAHSTVSAPKTQSMMDAYNRRSIECRLAAALVAAHARRERGIEGIEYIGDLTAQKTGLSESELETLVQAAVSRQPYRLADLAAGLRVSEHEVQQRWCLRRDGSVFPEPDDGFLIHKRLSHVYREWHRVERSVEALQSGDIGLFGTLMNESHASCRDLHQVSCRELDLLTEISRRAGAGGARLTGAGFGGCTVNLVPRESLDGYVDEVGHRYYRDQMGLNKWEDYLFVVEASDGAGPAELPAGIT